MSMTLQQVVPWGRSMAEYQRMFALTPADLNRRILGCGDGPASFNCEMTQLGRRVTSIDPTYDFSAAEIEQRIHDTYDTIIEQVEQSRDDYVWDDFADAHHLGQARLGSMQRFLADYEQGRQEHRYLPEALPALRFADAEFELALCSHFLFLYSAQLSLDFHLASLRELCRVATEVRVFPLLSLDCHASLYAEPARQHLSALGYTVEICRVPYEFQRGANQMLRISHRAG